jgi:phage gpG-like protein
MYKLEVINNSRKLSDLTKRLNTLPWNKVGRIAQRSIHRNFDSGGRPKKFRRKHAKPWPILKKTGALRNANKIEFIPDGTSIVNRLPYQAVHNFGYPVRGIYKNRYLMLQSPDKTKMINVFRGHLRVQ